MTKIKDYLEIDEEIKDAIINFSELQPDGRRKIWLGNCRLDFQKEYYLDSFTKKGVKLYWENGPEATRIVVIAKVFKDRDGDKINHKLVSEGWSYIQRFYTDSDIKHNIQLEVKKFG